VNVIGFAVSLSLVAISGAWAQSAGTVAIPVTVDNFNRAETDTYFAVRVKQTGLGNIENRREPMGIDDQSVVRGNRDTLYSTGVFDLDQSPVTITMPDAGKRFMSLQMINEDHYTKTTYTRGRHVFSRTNTSGR
jgi:hypothetical protein